MEVSGVSSQITPVIQTETLHQTNPAVEEIPQEQPQGGEIPEPEATEQSEDGQVEGVIRNLLNGHYKGVADLRLRINNFEALEAIENEQLKALAEEKVAGVLDVVDSGVDNILAPSESFTAEAAPEDETEPVNETLTVSGLHDEFVGAVNGLAEEFQSAEAPSTDEQSIQTLISGIQGAFTSFVESLQVLLVPTVDPNMDEGGPEDESISEDGEGQGISVVAEAPAANPHLESNIVAEAPVANDQEPPEPTEPNYQSLIDELGSAFAAAIVELIETLNGFQLLPELSEPSGNGVAYGNFLAIYNQMQTVETAEDDTAGNQEVDTVA